MEEAQNNELWGELRSLCQSKPLPRRKVEYLLNRFEHREREKAIEYATSYGWFDPFVWAKQWLGKMTGRGVIGERGKSCRHFTLRVRFSADEFPDFPAEGKMIWLEGVEGGDLGVLITSFKAHMVYKFGGYP